MSANKGTLYVVATPIGNLKDISARAIEVLQESDLVVAEDRERALKLLSHLDIRKPILTINAYNEERKADAIARQIATGKQCVLISGAGTPCISDPGNIVVRKCQDMGVDVRAVPGPSAVIAALSISGLSPDRFFFYGFLPQKRGKKRKIIAELLSRPFPVIFFESPRRLADTIEQISELAPDREVVLAKEMTKIYEELVRSRADQLTDYIPEDIKGEYTVIVAGTKFRKDRGPR
ncbi:MAG TPA: 16S rRNA (cytidine(1402)-2'-O)-methyltransferase [Syntrophorhabdales bacterium]|nr:16S rRNA (cytidine(1402)-2'-O)-methyltransferase [Syntrophorhabdales bacterium]